MRRRILLIWVILSNIPTAGIAQLGQKEEANAMSTVNISDDQVYKLFSSSDEGFEGIYFPLKDIAPGELQRLCNRALAIPSLKHHPAQFLNILYTVRHAKLTALLPQVRTLFETGVPSASLDRSVMETLFVLGSPGDKKRIDQAMSERLDQELQLAPLAHDDYLDVAGRLGGNQTLQILRKHLAILRESRTGSTVTQPTHFAVTGRLDKRLAAVDRAIFRLSQNR